MKWRVIPVLRSYCSIPLYPLISFSSLAVIKWFLMLCCFHLCVFCSSILRPPPAPTRLSSRALCWCARATEARAHVAPAAVGRKGGCTGSTELRWLTRKMAAHLFSHSTNEMKWPKIKRPLPDFLGSSVM